MGVVGIEGDGRGLEAGGDLGLASEHRDELGGAAEGGQDALDDEESVAGS